MVDFNDYYANQDKKREEQKKIQEQEEIKRLIIRYNDEIDHINKLIKAIIEKISFQPPERCDWIYVDQDGNKEEMVAAWRVYHYQGYEGSDNISIYMLPNGKLTYDYAKYAKYVKHIDYIEGLTLKEWKSALPFYCGIIEGNYLCSVPDHYELFGEKFNEYAKSIFEVEIDNNE